MNLTGLPPYQKGQKPKRSSKPTAAQRERWELIRADGCSVCRNAPEIHHCLTGAGGRKDHDKVIGLCYFHHRGPEGIHTISRKVWEATHGTEEWHLAQTLARLPLGRQEE